MKIKNLFLVFCIIILLCVGCANNDLKGEGVKITYSIDAEHISEKDIETTKNILSERINLLYSKNHNIEVDTANPSNPWIIVSIPNETDAENISKTLGTIANLQFIEEDGTIMIEGKDIISAKSMYGTVGMEENSYYIQLTLSDDGVKKLADSTEKNIGKSIYVLLDDTILMAPIVNERIESKKPIIIGNFTREQTTELANLISTGALPVKLKIENAEYVNTIDK